MEALCVEMEAIFKGFEYPVNQGAESSSFQEPESLTGQSCGSIVRTGSASCLVEQFTRRSRQVSNLSGKERHTKMSSFLDEDFRV